MEELAELATTAGATIIGEGTQKLDRPHVATFIGKGKAGEFAELANRAVDTVIFDEELSPAQTRNLERIFDRKVLDRTALILDIFAQRAHARRQDADRDGATAVHPAAIDPDVDAPSRQKGGIGMRGDGNRSWRLTAAAFRNHRPTARAEEVKRVRSTQRSGRQRSQWPLVSMSATPTPANPRCSTNSPARRC